MRPRMVLAALAAGTLALAGCGGGDEGPQGEPGAAGPPGIIVTNDAESLKVTITGVTVAGAPVVQFRVTDEADVPFIGVTSGTVRFTFAKLIAGSNGDPSRWQSYINVLETPSIGPGVTAKVQGSTDSGGTFVSNGDGTYSYTFGTNVTAVTTPLAVSYDGTLTHRLGMTLNFGGDIPAVNATYDFIPATGATTGLASREIAATASCNECHGRLAEHGGSRTDTKLCVTCHNPGSADADSGHTVDFTVMVHKIHMGSRLPSVIGGGDYIIYGRNDSEHDYSHVVFPQDPNNCTKCHDGGDAATPQGDNWALVPTREACEACHDDVDVSLGASGGHAAGAATNADCTSCHGAGLVAGSIEDSHTDLALVEARKYKFNLISVTQTAPSQFPRVTYSITNPLTGAAYALTDSPVANGSFSARFAWDTRDYGNTGAGATANSAPASAPSLSLLTGATNNGDGTYSKTFATAIPAGAVGSGVMTLEGRMAVDVTGPAGVPDGTRERIPVESEVLYFAITDTVAVPRRAIIEVTRCQNCHGVLNGLVLHGDSRSDNPDECVICHNPNNTDIAQRPVDPDGVFDRDNAAALDGLEDRAIDFRTLIHSIHGAAMRENPFVVYGFGSNPYDFSGAEFPGRLNYCETCHIPGTYYPADDTSTRLGVTIASGSTVTARSPAVVLAPAGANVSHADDLNVTPNAQACASCHDGALAETHMVLNGAAFQALQATLTGQTPETCAICHGPGRSADVKVVHGFE